MSETIEIQIGGKPYAFVLGKSRRIDGVTVVVTRSNSWILVSLENRYHWATASGSTCDEAFSTTLKAFRTRVRAWLRDARFEERRLQRRAAQNIADLRKQIESERAHLKRAVANARKELPKVEACAAKALAFGGGK